MSIAIKSTLNPLADSFIPSSCLKMLNKDEGTTPEVFNEKKTKHVPKDLTADFNSMHLGIKDDCSLTYGDLGMNFELSFSKKSMIETFLSGHNSLLSSVVQNFITPESTLCQQKSKLSVRQKHSKDSISIEDPADMDSSQVKEIKAQCHCPPMFGWIVPPEFFGNPFNFKYTCSKKNVHISDPAQDCNDIKILESRDNLSNLTLDECYLEVKDILADIFKCVSDYPDPIENIEGNSECFGEMIDDDEIDSGIESKRQSLDSDCQENLELVDDGCHPLLELTATECEDSDNESIARIEEILEDVLTPAAERCSKSLTSHRTVCNPPCSVWCDSVPTAAVSTYRKFITEMDITKNKNYEEKYLGKPIYKRSFSENDSSKYSHFDTNLSRLTSETESKERLTMLQKSQFNVLGGFKDRKKCTSYPLLSESLLKKRLNAGKDDSKMWGPFDGADSLWQPLPDCVPSNEQNLKQNSYRKARDMRRQKSVN